MEEPARKRRRTISPIQDERPSSPLKQPPRRPSVGSHAIAGANRSQSPLKQPPRRPSVSPTKAIHDRPSSPLKKPPRRPSFASPTKASLARNYPNLLRQPSPTSASATVEQNGHGNGFANGKEARAHILEGRDKRTRAEQEEALGRESGMTNGTTHTSRVRKTQNGKPHAQESERGGSEDSDVPLTPSHKDILRRGIPFSTPSKKPPKMKAPVQESSVVPDSSSIQEQAADQPGESKDKAQENANQKTKLLPDAELEQKRREKKQLLRELEELENQVSRCTEEIVKIQKQPSTHILSPKEREDLISVINKISKTSSEDKEAQTPSISNLLCSFLPFSTTTIPPPQSKQPNSNPIPSHQPLDLADPLPYLQMFTPLTIETRLDLPSTKPLPNPTQIHQRHTIQLTGPQNLLTASLSLVLDVPTSTITTLDLLTLSPWADRELGAFVRAKSLKCDLSNACWAVGSYWDMARKRAEHWHKCETAFAHLLPGHTGEDTENNVAAQQRGQKVEPKTITRRDMNRHLGRDVLVLQDRHVLLKLEWKIGFDWTGEAYSEVGCWAAVPKVWTETDENKSLQKIPETFDMILRSNGAFAATKTMVTLLFGEE
ncbi:hypothetical protein DM02DRAFT_615634 [Periconia macrospinosa]|uniref:Uncharacterized protein n=1 Tax=Periconia macrospinosa TaxID=97972 RepID=A0A2V1DN63_9PLEO|nr:hypothetical protein DM02DRAFT_615634 [Periconia macrospinosa]